MTRVFNFSPGPAALPEPVLRQVREELLDWNGLGASVMEISHRSEPFFELAARLETDLRELMGVPDDYRVLFLQGGAQLQFSMVPLNLLGGHNSADYALTGHWSRLAMQEGRRYCRVNIPAGSEDGGVVSIPDYAEWRVDDRSAYLHYTPNETVSGVEFPDVPPFPSPPLVADVTSSILSEPIDVSRFGLLYASAQKNIGPAGMTVVVVRDDLLGGTSPDAPKLFNYQRQAETGSMMNTVPTFIWYVSSLVLGWLRDQGGVEAMGRVNRRKAEKLYRAIDTSGGFYRNPVDEKSRSKTNVPFSLQAPELEAKFLVDAEQAGLYALKGHKAVGGMRASLYNAMPESGVDVLVDFMKEFHRVNG